jgi:hypothetical protein
LWNCMKKFHFIFKKIYRFSTKYENKRISVITSQISSNAIKHKKQLE